MTSDEALRVVDSAVDDDSVITATSAAKALAAEVRRLREERDVYEPAAKNWPAMLKRCETAEANARGERDRADAIQADLAAARAEAARLRGLAAKLSEQVFSVAGFLRGKDIPEYERVWQMAFDAKAELERQD